MRRSNVDHACGAQGLTVQRYLVPAGLVWDPQR